MSVSFIDLPLLSLPVLSPPQIEKDFEVKDDLRPRIVCLPM
jgi:hypothetical protein